MKMKEPLFLELSQLPTVETVTSVMKYGRIAITSKMFMMFLQNSHLSGHEMSLSMNSMVNQMTQMVSMTKNASV